MELKKIYRLVIYNMFIVKCPHCDMYIEILAINCAIFRCGIFKDTYLQMNPHIPRQQCEDLKNRDLIYGCGKPFKIENRKAKICPYI